MKRKDVQLIEDYRSGNLDAFNIFYNRYKDVLYTFLYNRSRKDANDLFQETFKKFIDAVSKRKINNPKSYLFQIGINLVRKQSRKAKVISLSDEFDLPDENEEKEEIVNEKDLQLSLAKLADKKPLFYDVLNLHIFGKMTFAEIGKIIQESSNTIASRYRYAIHYLKQYLQEEADLKQEVNYVQR
ncbi:MAG: sigma-70 family RNA polymerase sigma factor [Candidatus Cloacimonetes bacterium]|nr:sigma-70 family RNA polymerase sigma factor [Candidatus Cloacimonadota bacterium]MCF7815148.1 sigma-70 family RNA polymerase sigma factor [Candidatus Cloacimonadota bacterium]MCF7868013.1 sigma-70 family RNA polymerase sigma factor [Candidatus Cloacimonadota bacterium]MCF7883471.1 sigma-70 family RNA polymerase sigma factor [Candidatus Cloacimonadota bacterium]